MLVMTTSRALKRCLPTGECTSHFMCGVLSYSTFLSEALNKTKVSRTPHFQKLQSQYCQKINKYGTTSANGTQ